MLAKSYPYYLAHNAVLKDINKSKFGLQAGIFTCDIYKAQKAWDTLEVAV